MRSTAPAFLKKHRVIEVQAAASFTILSSSKWSELRTGSGPSGLGLRSAAGPYRGSR